MTRDASVIVGVAAPPSLEAISLLKSFPGISVPETVVRRLGEAQPRDRDLVALEVVTATVGRLARIPGVAGVAIYPLDLPLERTAEIIQLSREKVRNS